MKAIPNLGDRQAEIINLLESGEKTTRELADELDVVVPTVRDVVNRLEKRGIVESEPNPENPFQKLRRLADE